jgi:hypothetical protein
MEVTVLSHSKENPMHTDASAGRIRFRDEALMVAEVAYAIRDSLLEVKGVVQVEVNKRIGSILVLYDRSKTSGENILKRIAESLGVDVERVKDRARSAQKALTSAKGRRYVKRGMMASMAGALGVVAFSEKWHVAAGAVFVPLLALHMYQNKKTLMK